MKTSLVFSGKGVFSEMSSTKICSVKSSVLLIVASSTLTRIFAIAIRFANGFVDLTFFWVCFILPLDEIIEGARCFCTTSAVILGQVMKKPALIALIHVSFAGKKHAACKYLTVLSIEEILNTLFMECSLMLVFVPDFLDLSSRFTSHNLLLWFRWPVIMTVPLKTISTIFASK